MEPSLIKFEQGCEQGGKTALKVAWRLDFASAERLEALAKPGYIAP
jgi:nitrogen fixation protein